MSSPGIPRAIAPASSPNKPSAQYVEDWFVYELDQLALTNGNTANNNIQIQADSDFKLVKIAGMADIAAAAETASTLVIPLVTINLVDTGSGRTLFSNPVPWGTIVGTPGLPFILPVPRIFKARSNISIALVNYSAATTYNLHLGLIGTKIFTLG